jgi:hypothetical protein
VLRGQCLDCRIATPERLVSEIAAWERQRSATGAKVKWMFTTEKARAKMGRAYPEPASHNPCATELGRVYNQNGIMRMLTAYIIAAKQVSVFS